MRGTGSHSESLFTTVKLEDFVPSNHPLRPIHTWVNEALAKMDVNFLAIYEAHVKNGKAASRDGQVLRRQWIRQGRSRDGYQ